MYLLAYLQLMKVQVHFLIHHLNYKTYKGYMKKNLNRCIYKCKKIIFETSKLMEKFNIQQAFHVNDLT